MEEGIEIRDIRRLLVANRGEIAIRIMRAANELGIRTVALYTHEDRYSLHRYKADEAYRIGSVNEPLKPYLDIDEIITLAKKRNIDAIHPGYGFLSENVDFARRCEEEGIVFVGPRSHVMNQLGDKTDAKIIAKAAGIPVIEGALVDAEDRDRLRQAAQKIGYPLLVKAAAGGGGRGMRVVHSEEALVSAAQEASREAAQAFGSNKIFLEKFIENPKHLEVQLIGDNYGAIIHLHERDCSVQRRFQKVIEMAPAPLLSDKARNQIHNYALTIGKHVKYNNAGTVEFLLDSSDNVYFIEVNPRIQVEHTVTEEVTGIDIVRAQILIAAGHPLNDPLLNLGEQSSIRCSGFAIQCRITTEDPQNNFLPDYGRMIAYRSPGGYGIRLDAGSAYAGAVISPFFDSMLVKVTVRGTTLNDAAGRLSRALREFRIRGIKTNVAFLLNVINHPIFQSGKSTVGFIADFPELLRFKPGRDRATRVIAYLAEVIVNGNPDVKKGTVPPRFTTPRVPRVDTLAAFPYGSRDRLKELGREGFVQWLKNEHTIQFTDTTFRDAHQSLLATRVRTYDLLTIAEAFARRHPEVFSMEVWGGATFDVALRFLHECPWERLQLLREQIPNILFQMLLRGSNAVGYSAYPNNLIIAFIEEAAEAGIDIFRIFDSMNWLEAMKGSIKAVRERTNSLAEVCVCYTGDILNKNLTKFNLQYYKDLAKKIEDEGAHILCIKDMAGLLKPYAAEVLIGELKQTIKLPIHLHTHDTSSVQSATYLKAVEAGVDVIDVALASMSGLTSQPNFNSLIEVLKDNERRPITDRQSLDEFSAYWERVREYYFTFESGLKAGTGDVYRHEIPGGQYSNLKPQARALGLEDRFEEIKETYARVNEMLGGVIKVTPSSKVVGDFALFLTSNDLSVEDVMERGEELSFPESVKSFFKGELGQPYGGFPEKLQKIVLKGEKPITDHPNSSLEPVDFEAEIPLFQEKFGSDLTKRDFLSYKLYPKVFEDYIENGRRYGRLAALPTPPFLYGLLPHEECMVEIAEGKTLMVQFVYKEAPDEEGVCRVHFKLNGQSRAVDVQDQSVAVVKVSHRKAKELNEIGSPLQGKLARVLVEADQKVKKGDPMFIIEAMKMETIVNAPRAAKVTKIELQEGTMLMIDDLVIELDK